MSDRATNEAKFRLLSQMGRNYDAGAEATTRAPRGGAEAERDDGGRDDEHPEGEDDREEQQGRHHKGMSAGIRPGTAHPSKLVRISYLMRRRGMSRKNGRFPPHSQVTK